MAWGGGPGVVLTFFDGERGFVGGGGGVAGGPAGEGGD